MDRRTILAFGLIFMILMTSNLLLNKYFGEDPLTAEADSTSVAIQSGEDINPGIYSEPGSITQEVVNEKSEIDVLPLVESADQACVLIKQGHEKTISVSTPLYELEISTLGGQVVSYKCLAYDSYLGGPVQLIPEIIPSEVNEAVLFRRGEIQLKSVVYQTDENDIVLSEGEGFKALTLTTFTAGGMQLKKVFTFNPDTYGIQVDFLLAAVDLGASEISLNLLGSPESFRFGWTAGISTTERQQKMEKPALRTTCRIGNDYHNKKRMNLQKSEEKVTESFRGSIHFAGIQNKYFTATGIVPGNETDLVDGKILLGGDKETMAQSWALEIPAKKGNSGEIAVASMDLYIGPMIEKLLLPYERGVENSIDLGMKIIRPLSEVVLLGMEKMHLVISNYGVIIIIFAILSKLIFFPLTKTSTQSMKKMQEIQPKIKAIQEKYKDDKEKLNTATMQLYKEEKVNPLAGCLPMLIPMPIFFALYQAFNHTIVLRGQPFVFWITDLSQPDSIAQLPFSLPILGSDLNILPILMSVAMYFQSKFTPQTSGGGQMAAMTTMMPLMMVFIFYNMPSGLVLYWLINTIMQGYQTWSIQRSAPTGGAA